MYVFNLWHLQNKVWFCAMGFCWERVLNSNNCEFETEIANILEYESGAQICMVNWWKKERLKISRYYPFNGKSPNKYQNNWRRTEIDQHLPGTGFYSVLLWRRHVALPFKISQYSLRSSPPGPPFPSLFFISFEQNFEFCKIFSFKSVFVLGGKQQQRLIVSSRFIPFLWFGIHTAELI